MPVLNDTRPVDQRYCGIDAEGKMYWMAANVGIGAWMHEVSHLFGCPHQESEVMLRCYPRLNRSFYAIEPSSFPNKVEWGKCRWHALDVRHPCFTLPSDPAQPVEDFAHTSINVFGTEDSPHIACAAGILLIEFYDSGGGREFPKTHLSFTNAHPPPTEHVISHATLSSVSPGKGTEPGHVRMLIFSCASGVEPVDVPDVGALLRTVCDAAPPVALAIGTLFGILFAHLLRTRNGSWRTGSVSSNSSSSGTPSAVRNNTAPPSPRNSHAAPHPWVGAPQRTTSMTSYTSSSSSPIPYLPSSPVPRSSTSSPRSTHSSISSSPSTSSSSPVSPDSALGVPGSPPLGVSSLQRPTRPSPLSQGSTVTASSNAPPSTTTNGSGNDTPTTPSARSPTSTGRSGTPTGRPVTPTGRGSSADRGSGGLSVAEKRMSRDDSDLAQFMATPGKTRTSSSGLKGRLRRALAPGGKDATAPIPENSVVGPSVSTGSGLPTRKPPVIRPLEDDEDGGDDGTDGASTATGATKKSRRS
ncbi:hypothetical protein FISHEDRAFT_73322, partial [Fistulina hepatica ATCC 64428]